ncbi:Six-bladed beta-propeller, TolB-like,LDLR class B repeat [Cinara cedri]|uniref:Six-bladed beta-propeller, TolB-like,LDLR class B repeat n=1 Tax=Cinara cedri TaxID=506608 RepID=A0A5E4N926_9HEMI|nr:Six-bladed beta-propeller, TolB-like,LDLR class B repeat [Cinara cedri]
MYSPKFALVISLVIFTAHSVQPFGGLGVITKSHVQFFNGHEIQKTIPIHWENINTIAKLDPETRHVYKNEKPNPPVDIKDLNDGISHEENTKKQPTIAKKNSDVNWDHHNMVATYDPVEKQIYFSGQQMNQKNASIYRLKQTGNPEHPHLEIVVSEQNESVSGMTFNDHTNTLYWTSGNTIKHTKVVQPMIMYPSNGTVLMRLEESIPGEIQVDKCRGYLYYTNWLRSGLGRTSTIERTRLDGSHREILFNFEGLVLLALTVDSADNRLYWAVLDPSKRRNAFSVESSDLDGGSRKMVIGELDHLPRGIVLDGNLVYWFDTRSKSLWKTPKNGSEFPTKVIKFNDNNNLPTRIMTANSCSHNCAKVQKKQHSKADEYIKSIVGHYPSETISIVDLS